VVVPMWEWAVSRDSQGGALGVSMTRHAAMEALSKALIAAGHPSCGRVAQIKLIRPIDGDPAYLRGFPERTASYDGTVTQWS
jgi:hypothetical protein